MWAGGTKPGPLPVLPEDRSPAERRGAPGRPSGPWTAAPARPGPGAAASLRPAAAPAEPGPGRKCSHGSGSVGVRGRCCGEKKAPGSWGGCVLLSMWLWQRDPTGCKGWVMTDAPAGAGTLGTVLSRDRFALPNSHDQSEEQ